MPASLLLLELKTAQGPIEGECALDGYEGQILLESFAWSIEDSTVKVGELAKRVVKVGKLRLSKVCDRSSTALCNLMKRDAGDEERPKYSFSSATLRMVDPNSQKLDDRARTIEPIMELVLTNGWIDEVSIRVSEQGKTVSVKEDVTLSVSTEVSLTYATPYDERKKAPVFFYRFPARKGS